MAIQNIILLSFGYFEKELMEQVVSAVEHEFRITPLLREGRIDLGEYFDAGRRQYNGNLLLKHLTTLPYPESVKLLGLFNVDLFIPILTFIFGQAFLGGKCGIASMYRLNNTSYGLKPDDAILAERFKKEAIHELGHQFGLIHCHQLSCVMKSSTYVEDIDQKSANYCPACRLELSGEKSVPGPTPHPGEF